MSDRVIVFSWGRSDTCPGVRVSANAQRQTCRAPGVAPGPEAGLLATNPPCCPRAGRAHGAGGARGRARVEALRWIYSLSHAAAGRCCAAPRTALPPPPRPAMACPMRVVLVAASALIALVVAALQWRENECTAAAAGAAAEGAARRCAARRCAACNPRSVGPDAVDRGCEGRGRWGGGASQFSPLAHPQKKLRRRKRRRAPPWGPRRRARAGADHGLCVVRSRAREGAAGRLRALPREEAVSQSFAWL